MILSKEDMFSEAQSCATTTATVSENALDFHAHGGDVMGNLFWSVVPSAAIASIGVTVAWETSDAEDFSVAETVFTKTTGAVAAGEPAIDAEPVPKGCRRYNRLKYTLGDATEGNAFTAFLHDGRDEGQPYRG